MRLANFTKPVLAQRTRVLGAEHSDTIDSIEALALIIQDQGDLSVARRLQEGALKVRRRLVAPGDIALAPALSNLAVTVARQGDWKTAATLAREIVDACESALGPDHRNTLRAKHELAKFMKGGGHLGESLHLHELTLKARVRLLGTVHEDTLESEDPFGNGTLCVWGLRLSTL